MLRVKGCNSNCHLSHLGQNIGRNGDFLPPNVLSGRDMQGKYCVPTARSIWA